MSRAARRVLFVCAMHAFLMSALLGASAPHATAQVRQAEHEVQATRAQWDAAVAGDHPVAAGAWARKHFDALQKLKAAKR